MPQTRSDCDSQGNTAPNWSRPRTSCPARCRRQTICLLSGPCSSFLSGRRSIREPVVASWTTLRVRLPRDERMTAVRTYYVREYYGSHLYSSRLGMGKPEYKGYAWVNKYIAGLGIGKPCQKQRRRKNLPLRSSCQIVDSDKRENRFWCYLPDRGVWRHKEIFVRPYEL